MRVISVVVCLALVAGSARADRGEPWDGRTVGIQTGGGVSGLTLGGGAGALIGFLVGAGFAKRGDWGTPMIGLVGGAVLGGTVGLGFGVQLTGDELDGRGRWWGTTAGTVAGVGLSTAFLIATARRPMGHQVKLAVCLAMLLTGPIVGYHLSADEPAFVATPLSLTF